VNIYIFMEINVPTTLQRKKYEKIQSKIMKKQTQPATARVLRVWWGFKTKMWMKNEKSRKKNCEWED
jgi:hypothetical protein